MNPEQIGENPRAIFMAAFDKRLNESVAEGFFTKELAHEKRKIAEILELRDILSPEDQGRMLAEIGLEEVVEAYKKNDPIERDLKQKIGATMAEINKLIREVKKTRDHVVAEGIHDEMVELEEELSKLMAQLEMLKDIRGGVPRGK